MKVTQEGPVLFVRYYPKGRPQYRYRSRFWALGAFGLKFEAAAVEWLQARDQVVFETEWGWGEGPPVGYRDPTAPDCGGA